jgi:uncharacterized protein YlxW (UPF0749 family)
VAEQQVPVGRTAPEPPPGARRGLLDQITATSLDEDYAHVSRRRAAEGTVAPSGRGRVGAVALVVLAVFGVLVATAGVQTARDADEVASSRASLVAQANDRRAGLAQRRATLQRLQAEVATAQSRRTTSAGEITSLRARVGRLGLLAGFAATRGPGVEVHVDDAPKARTVQQVVQSGDLQKLVNGLWQVGAEAVSINGQRITSLTAIRDAADAVTVNFASLSRPYTVSAVGNPKDMGARLLDTAGGETWLALQSSYGLKFDVETKDSMVLPAAKAPALRSARRPVRR